MNSLSSNSLFDQRLDEEPSFAGHHSPDVETERVARKIRERVVAEIEDRGLRSYIGDLEIDGYTILPPEVVGPASFIEELLERTLEALVDDCPFDLDI